MTDQRNNGRDRQAEQQRIQRQLEALERQQRNTQNDRRNGSWSNNDRRQTPQNIDRATQQRIQRERQQQYNNRWRNWENTRNDRIRRLERENRRNYIRYQNRYWERIRRDQERLQRQRYYNNLVYNYRYYRGGNYYYTSQYGVQMLRDAVNYGYEEGFRAGLADREDNWGYNYQSSFGYMDASYGYDSYYVDFQEYNYYFRQGFQRGYEDGYYGRYQYGRYNNGRYSILGGILGSIFEAILF